MSTETVNILALILGFLGIVVVAFGIWVTFIISKRTDKLIQTEDERAKALIRETQRLIEEENARTERLIDEGRKETRELISYMVKILEGMEKRAKERHRELLMR